MPTPPTIRQELNRKYPTEESCLELIFCLNHTSECWCGGTYSPHKGKRKYQCGKCKKEISPMSNTIFHKSRTPLKVWFEALILFSDSAGNITARKLQRQLKITYKSAWRMLSIIKKFELRARKIAGPDFFGLLEGIIQCLSKHR